MQKVKKLLAFSYLSSLFFYLSILIFIISFNFTDTPPPQSGWYQQWMPNLGGKQIADVTFLDSLTGWAVTGDGFPNDSNYILKTTNGGDNWLFQVPMTDTPIYRYFYTEFINKLNGWAYYPVTGVHTVTGGDTIFYMGIIQKSNNIPNDFELKQNYPNPFNQRTIIPFSLKKAAQVNKINGRE